MLHYIALPDLCLEDSKLRTAQTLISPKTRTGFAYAREHPSHADASVHTGPRPTEFGPTVCHRDGNGTIPARGRSKIVDPIGDRETVTTARRALSLRERH